MTRLSLPAQPRPLLSWTLTLAGLILAIGSIVATGRAAAASLAVAPFENEDAVWALSAPIARQLSEAKVDRLLPPGSFVAEPVFEASPEAIRRWAYRAAVENVLVGRVVAPEKPSMGGDPAPGRQVEIALHSGHSGAEIARHAMRVGGPGAIAAAAETLAAAVLGDLGLDAPAAAPPAAAARASEPAAEGQSGRGLDAAFDLPGFSKDAPIEIKAEEAEIVNRKDGRDLIFQRNVFVRQANVTVRSERLEAIYDKGESDPRKLVAEGKVHVDQGDREAFCDRAVFLRDSQLLTCVGHAELIQGCDIVRGDSIQFDLADDRARVEGAASIVIRPKDEAGADCPDVRGVL